ncbi:MAG: DUF1015 domain-containing protein [Candidatus Sumerlaeaceae bacterium]|nr:DUF1015 domain-containing protein [Candidatus Sumerlaeaceae bacterium]
MADILPFIGTRYNSQLIGNLSCVLAPPYDVISPEMQDELYARHENNVVRLILGKDEAGDDNFSNKYVRAANTLKAWRSDGILIEDEKPAIYCYEQEFKMPSGEIKRRRGFFALVKLEDYASGRIRAHEQTFAGPKADRLKLLRATHANLSAIFVIFNDPKNEVMSMVSERMTDKPWEEVTDDDGVIHRLWVVQKRDFLVRLREAMQSRQLFIADGHHRYETAINFRNEMREATGRRDGNQPFDYMMMYLTNAEQDGLVILPTHRVLSRSFMSDINMKEVIAELKENFDLKDDKVDLAKPDTDGRKVIETVEKLGKKSMAFGMVSADGKVKYLTLKKGVSPVDLVDDDELQEPVKRLDVTVLHHYILNHVFVGNPEFELEEDECFYVRDVKRVFDLLKSRKAGLAFIMNATPMDQVTEIVKAGIKMPHKSTYFHPKIISGLVIRNMDCEMKKPASGKR